MTTEILTYSEADAAAASVALADALAPTPDAPTATLYSVTGWDRHFENSRSRNVQDLAWVPVPNRFDGEKYSLLMQHKQAAQLFSAWILILEVASRCNPRGTLKRSDGTPHDPASLALKTRAPAAWFELALPFFTKNRWLVSEVITLPNDAADCQPPDTRPSPAYQAGGEERKNRTEGTEQKAGSFFVSDKPEPIRTRLLAVNALKNRNTSTRWSAKEFAAFREAGLDQMADHEFAEEIAPLAIYYAAPAAVLQEHWRCDPGNDFRRRDLLTLLNNWPGEVDRARAAAHWLAKKSEAAAAARG